MEAVNSAATVNVANLVLFSENDLFYCSARAGRRTNGTRELLFMKALKYSAMPHNQLVGINNLLRVLSAAIVGAFAAFYGPICRRSLITNEHI